MFEQNLCSYCRHAAKIRKETKERADSDYKIFTKSALEHIALAVKSFVNVQCLSALICPHLQCHDKVSAEIMHTALW
jgi:hypothetical protein